MNLRGWNHLLLSVTCYLGSINGAVVVQEGPSRDDWPVSVSRTCTPESRNGGALLFNNKYSSLGKLHTLVFAAVSSSKVRPSKRSCRIRKGRMRCTGKLPCSSVWKKTGPVCGPDGRLYPSLCQLFRYTYRFSYDIVFRNLGLWKGPWDAENTTETGEANDRLDSLVTDNRPPATSNQVPMLYDHSSMGWRSRGDMIARLFRSKVRDYVQKHNLPRKSRMDNN